MDTSISGLSAVTEGPKGLQSQPDDEDSMTDTEQNATVMFFATSVHGEIVAYALSIADSVAPGIRMKWYSDNWKWGNLSKNGISANVQRP